MKFRMNGQDVAREDKLSITSEPEGALEWLRDLCYNVKGPMVEQAVTSFISAVGQHVQDRSRLNAPILHNRLRPSIRFTGVKKTGTNTWRGTVVAGSSGIYWAGLMHAYLSPHETGPSPSLNRPYRLGSISRAQPSTEEGGVGGTYLSRVGAFHFPKYEKALGTAFTQMFNAGKSPSFKF